MFFSHQAAQLPGSAICNANALVLTDVSLAPGCKLIVHGVVFEKQVIICLTGFLSGLWYQVLHQNDFLCFLNFLF